MRRRMQSVRRRMRRSVERTAQQCSLKCALCGLVSVVLDALVKGLLWFRFAARLCSLRGALWFNLVTLSLPEV